MVTANFGVYNNVDDITMALRPVPEPHTAEPEKAKPSDLPRPRSGTLTAALEQKAV